MNRHSSGLCRKHLAATLRQWVTRREGLLDPILTVATVWTLLFDAISIVAPHNYASTHSTEHWDDLCKYSLAFFLHLCAEHDLKLLIQSADVRDRLEGLYRAQGLEEVLHPPGFAFASVARSFTVPIVVSSNGEGAVLLAVHAVTHPSGFLTYADTVAILRLQVCTPRPRRVTARPSSCSGPRRAQARVFVQAEQLQKLVPVELRGMFAGVLNPQLREYWGDVVRAFALRQPDEFLSLLELHRAGPDGLKQLLRESEVSFSAVDSDAIGKAVDHCNHRRYVATLSLERTLTPAVVSQAINGTGDPVILHLPDSALEWELARILAMLGGSFGLLWPAEPTAACMKLLVRQVLRCMFRSEGGTLGAAAVLTRAPASRIPRSPRPRPPARALWTGGLAPAGLVAVSACK